MNTDGTSVIAATSTDGNGNYSFANLETGTYQVQYVLPDGYQYSPYLQGSDTGIDSNANPANAGLSGPITLSAGQDDLTWDAGLVQNTPPPVITVNLCVPIRTPGFWKNYDNHMTDATFLSLLNATQDFSGLNVKDAVSILSDNNGKSKVSGFKGVDARDLKFLLTAEINAVWNGQDNATALDGHWEPVYIWVRTDRQPGAAPGFCQRRHQ